MSVCLSIPTKEEQKRISDFLVLLQKKIDIQKEIVKNLKKYKRGALTKIFSQSISFTHFEKNWKKTTLGEVCQITMGQSPDSESYNTDGIGMPLVQGNADMKNGLTAPQRYTNRVTKVCENGSIILSVRAPVGSVGRANQRVCIGRGVCALQCDNNDFLFYLLQNIEPFWKRIEQGGTFTAISGDDISEMEIGYPSTEERKIISSFFILLDQHINNAEKVLTELSSCKNQLLARLFI